MEFVCAHSHGRNSLWPAGKDELTCWFALFMSRSHEDRKGTLQSRVTHCINCSEQPLCSSKASVGQLCLSMMYCKSA